MNSDFPYLVGCHSLNCPTLIGFHMELLERNEQIKALSEAFRRVQEGVGKTIFIEGEAGIGKTALVRTFLEELQSPHLLLEGFCDSLYAARPLGPIFDIAADLDGDFRNLLRENASKNDIFSTAYELLGNQTMPVILLFEDIHWADAASLDFIRFLSRRIRRIPCMFILTLRENELQESHPYRHLLGDLPPTHIHKIILKPFSIETVASLAEVQGRSGEEVFSLTGGIPYYVTEVLSSYHKGIPENVKDSILSVYQRQFDSGKELWEILAVTPNRIELEILHQIKPVLSKTVDFCLRSGILKHDGTYISFKHELFRTAIEEHLSPLRQQELHQQVVNAMLETESLDIPSPRIVHHARLAGDKEKITRFAPLAAEEASKLGSHQEAAKFYQLALKHSQEFAPEVRANLIEKRAYELSLTNRIKEAIDSLSEALKLREKRDYPGRGKALCFQSRLLWFTGRVEEANTLGMEAIEMLEPGGTSHELAMAYSNMGLLKMYADNRDGSLEWSNKAIDLARSMNDREVLTHALNNLGTTLLRWEETADKGEAALRESLQLAIDEGLHEHIARAYFNLGHAFAESGRYDQAEKVLMQGIEFAETRELNSWMTFMENSLAQVMVETARWKEAEAVLQRILPHLESLPLLSVRLFTSLGKIKMRRGDESAGENLLTAAEIGGQFSEHYRYGGILKALLEYEWLYGKTKGITTYSHQFTERFGHTGRETGDPELHFWLWKSEGAGAEKKEEILRALKKSSKENPYLHALVRAEGRPGDQAKALILLKDMGASKTADKVEWQMRQQGIKHIPRGPRASTRKNPAGLTRRQMEVLNLLSEGLQNKEIASQLYLSAKTVDHHISAILTKLDAQSRTMAVSRAKEMEILK